MKKNPAGKPFRTGDGRRFATQAEAISHANDVYRRTGNVISVVDAEAARRHPSAFTRDGRLKKNPPIAIFANPGRSIGRGKEKITLDESGYSESHGLAYLQRSLAEIQRLIRIREYDAAQSQARQAEEWVELMQKQVGQGFHKNPARDRGRIGGQLMSREVYEIAYKHVGDGKDYKHDFGPGVQMISEADGVIRLQHQNPAKKLWEDF